MRTVLHYTGLCLLTQHVSVVLTMEMPIEVDDAIIRRKVMRKFFWDNPEQDAEVVYEKIRYLQQFKLASCR